MPADTIKRNIDKATGNLEGVNYEEIRYEGYGIGGAAIIVDTMTDNRVRTVAEVRHAFSKYGGNMGTEGSVAFQFKHCGQLMFAPGTSEDKVMEVALEAGADDVHHRRRRRHRGADRPADFEAVKNALEAAGLKPEMAEVTMRAENTIELAGDDAAAHAEAAGRAGRPGRRAGRLHNAELEPDEGLVIGGGGREHALAWKLAQSPKVQPVYVAPGNGGTARDPAENVPITDIGAGRLGPGRKDRLTVVGPEAPLAAGVVDEFRAHGLRIFGPTRRPRSWKAPRPSPRPSCSATASPPPLRDLHRPGAAHAYVDKQGAPIVIKADGLAAGKGVVVAMTLEEAHAAIDDMLVDNTLGVAHNAGGARVVIEEFLAGEEASFIVLCDGKNVLALATSQDHKRLLDGDEGPNTGGMGAYSPGAGGHAQCACPRHARDHPAHRARHGQGRHPLHRLPVRRADDRRPGPAQDAGVQLPHGRPRNPAHPDAPEERPGRRADAATDGTLDQVELQWDRRTALGVVLAAHGYPANPRKGDAITGLPGRGRRRHGVPRRHRAGARRLRTSGGRVLCVTALGDNGALAQQRAYDWRAASSSTARSTAATSATAPSRPMRPRLTQCAAPTRQPMSMMTRRRARYLLGLQARITARSQAEDGKAFRARCLDARPASRCRATA
jgi:phosphoribosylamine--glycine ligase